ncbi:MAG: hypothetical protein U5N86_03575 [Planctomycetota bacterium]|nr:hypothetical protein [Planctomycetota bacterium]
MLAVGPHEKGTVAFFASSFDGSWCNLPVLPMFPPLVHELCYFCLNSGTDDLNTLTGGSVQIPFEIADASGPAKLLLPSGSSLELLLDVKSKNLDISGDVLREPGIYTVRFANDREVVFAVNVPASEGDLTALSSNALKGMFENFSPRYVLASDTPHETDAALPDDLRRALFVAALALLLLEMLLASLFSRQPARTTLSIETEVFSQ